MGQLEGGGQRGPISQDNCPPGSEAGGGSTSTHPIKTQLKLFSDPSPPSGVCDQNTDQAAVIGNGHTHHRRGGGGFGCPGINGVGGLTTLQQQTQAKFQGCCKTLSNLRIWGSFL